jgi:uncharacterized protein with von Willebrand factor type A (vWA) domain
LDATLQGFTLLLRQNGLRVSPAELADAAEALALLPLEEKAQVRAALRATLVKRGADAPVFDRLFSLHFEGGDALLRGLEASLLRQLDEEGLTELELEQVAEELARLSLSPLTSALAGRAGDRQGPVAQEELRRATLARLLRQAILGLDFRGLQSPLQRGFYARRLLQAAGAGRAESDFSALQRALRDRGLGLQALERVDRAAGRTLRALEEAAGRVAEQEQRSRDAAGAGTELLRRRSLATLSPAEVEQLRALVKQLAEKLKARLSRRRRTLRRGQLSVRRTIRKNLSSGGEPALLVFRARRSERPEIVVLCDVSDSVRNASRLMLQFVYTLQSLYARVRSFVFVSDLGEVTNLFKKVDVATAVDLATAGRVINLSANSNYGNALSTFHRTYLGAVGRRTTVLVLGDGRCNGNPPNAWILGEVRRRCRRLLWLCPEERASWGLGDSEMPAFARHCHRVEPVRSVDDLARFAEALLP